MDFGRVRRVPDVDWQLQLIRKGSDECFVLIALFASELVVEMCESKEGMCTDTPSFSKFAECSKHCNAISAATYGQYTGGSAPAVRWPELEDRIGNLSLHLWFRCGGRFVEISSGRDYQVVGVNEFREGFINFFDLQVGDLSFKFLVVGHISSGE